MNINIIFGLLRKDLILFFSNRFFALITFLALFAYAAIYFLMPSEIDETLELVIYAPNFPTSFLDELAKQGLVLNTMESEGTLIDSVREGQNQVGAVLSSDFFQKLISGQKAEVQLYFSSNFDNEFKEVYALLFTEIGYMISGKPLNIQVSEEILGEDRLGDQIAYRDRLLPLLVVMILMFETLGLASLIASEISTGTISALLVTPVRVEGLFIAKGILGVGLAFLQALLLMAIVGGLSNQPAMIIIILLLGSVLVTGLAFLVASISKDMMSAMGWGMLAIVVLSLPSFSVLLPGSLTGWVKIIPSYHVVDPVYRIVNYAPTWEEVSANLIILVISAVLFLSAGIIVLRRKFQ
jgi:ABC-2 type transport system permease protein